MQIKISNTLLAWYLLYYTYGLLPIVAGLDKYFNVIADWNIYLNADIPALFGIHPAMFMHLASAIEVIVGLLVFLRPRLGGYLVTAWLIGVSINLISMTSHSHGGEVVSHYDIALRDIALAIGAYVFVLLSKELNKK